MPICRVSEIRCKIVAILENNHVCLAAKAENVEADMHGILRYSCDT